MQRQEALAGQRNYNQLKECRHGRMLFNVNDKYIGRSLDLYGEFSEAEVTLLTRYLTPGDTVVEVGANVGAHTVPLAKAVSADGARGDGGSVFAFEPQRLIFQTLCANLALNGLANVYAFPYAVGEEPGAILVPDLDPTCINNFAAMELDKTYGAGDPVAVVRLDDLDIPPCRLLKIDVEGMELSVLKGAQELIARDRPLLFVENDRKEKSDDLVRFIASLGYSLYWHRPWMFNRENFRGETNNVFPNIASFNMFCIGDGTLVDPPMPAVKVPAEPAETPASASL